MLPLQIAAGEAIQTDTEFTSQVWIKFGKVTSYGQRLRGQLHEPQECT